MVPARLTADERRTAVLAAAISEFAQSGYAGTSTEAIAARAGISQPYLFRLFGTKKDLFVATYELVANRIIGEFARASQGLEGQEALAAMGAAYLELMQDPELLQVQLHGFAAAPGDPDIAASCRRTFEAIKQLFFDRTHLSGDELREFFATGMLINVMAAIDLQSVAEPWAQDLCAAPEKAEAVEAMAAAVRAHQTTRSDDTDHTDELDEADEKADEKADERADEKADEEVPA